MAGRLLILSIACLAGIVSSIAQAQAPDQDAMITREIALLEFYGGGSRLSPAEHQEAIAIVQQGLHDNRAAELAADARGAQLLQALSKGDARLIALARETGRLNAALNLAKGAGRNTPAVREARIIEAHDPTIVFDAPHRRLISRQTVIVLMQANVLGAQLFGVRSRPASVDDLTATLRAQYPAMDQGMQDALAHAERDMPYAAPYLQQAAPQKRTALIADYRQKIMAGADASAQQLRLAEVMAVTGAVGFKHAAAGGGPSRNGFDRLQSQTLLQHQMTGAMRSFSPTCNVATGAGMANFSSCHP